METKPIIRLFQDFTYEVTIDTQEPVKSYVVLQNIQEQMEQLGFRPRGTAYTETISYLASGRFTASVTGNGGPEMTNKILSALIKKTLRETGRQLVDEKEAKAEQIKPRRG